MIERMVTLYLDALSWESLKPQLAPIYGEAFTEAQIDDLLAFPKSPTGRALADKEVVLMTKMTGIMQERMRAIAPELQKITQEFAQELAGTMRLPPTPKPAPAKPQQ